MKIGLNLALRESGRDRYALAWSLPATLVGLAGLVLLGMSAQRQFREYRLVHSQVADVQAKEAQIRGQEQAVQRKLDQPEFQNVFRQVRYVNSLIDQKRVSVTGLAARVTKLMSGEVRLGGMALAPEGEGLLVRLVVSGLTDEAVETFLNNLEDARDFSDVQMANQGFQQEGTSTAVTISCTAHYHPGASPETGK